MNGEENSINTYTKLDKNNSTTNHEIMFVFKKLFGQL